MIPIKSQSSWTAEILNLVKRKNIKTRLKNTTTLNVALGLPGMFQAFTLQTQKKLHTVAITSSTFSVLCGCCSFYLLYNYDKRDKVFRHELITLLTVCDFIKTLILMIYPTVLKCDRNQMGNQKLYNTLGFLTAFAIEGADLAILVFAIHFALLIFKPDMKWENKKTKNIDGGLFKCRYYVWPIVIILPFVFASLAFIDYSMVNFKFEKTYTELIIDDNDLNFEFQARTGGYKPLSTMCYFPPSPIWYKLALSWGLRYFLVLFILITYACIYISVSRQTSLLNRTMKELGYSPKQEKDDPLKKSNIFKRILKSFFQLIAHVFLPIIERDESDSDESADNLLLFSMSNVHDNENSNNNNYTNSNNVTENGNVQAGLHFQESNKHMESSTTENNTKSNTDMLHNIFSKRNRSGNLGILNHEKSEVDNLQQGLRRETYLAMYHRRNNTRSNLRSIFIYPFSYICLWAFPIAIDITQYRYEIDHGPIIWLAYIGAFVYPLSSFVDLLVISYREKPWKHSWRQVEKKSLMDTYRYESQIGEDEIIKLCNSPLGKLGWYYYSLPSEEVGLFSSIFSMRKSENGKRMKETPSTDSGISTPGSFSSGSKYSHHSFNHSSNTMKYNNLSSSLPEISLYWRLIHTLPMLQGVNLYEFNEELKSINGISDIIRTKTENDTCTTVKIISNVTKNNSTVAHNNLHTLTENNELKKASSERHEVAYNIDFSNITLNNTNFSDVVNTTSTKNYPTTTQQKNDGKVTLIEFLRG
ncbi:hypothetical protein TPHA_0M00350 [Tetrapisispora phaffii CBS 4417]|uniref:G-protein coupled receptors family 1 profile domain-containing protein n=1 Tax=Tetrapisispora phaffii (strain ATCC 24235 / CBS 4417 / NBRC 1672 / NRRL Y-8282 / UCD 70-5) TaxID=1071381 RepID=G8C0U9_TETPH|nr:hypothetical protein TPHA_0M00350 [Tetrapisispora phaffii CBS 4417]CCE65610.1 hypothetical protein TPHA_0M00350 [Tetrapisispora phaffii CBS 4417]